MVPAFAFVDELLECDRSKKATEKYFPVVMFIVPYKVFLIFERVDELLKGDHTNEFSSAVLSKGAV